MIGMRNVIGFSCAIALAVAQTPANSPDAAPLFSKNCAYCHGSRGQGGRGADLTTGIYTHGGSDADLFKTIRNGIPGAMPAVAITDNEVRTLVAFFAASSHQHGLRMWVRKLRHIRGRVLE